MNDLWVIGLTGATAAGVLGWPLVRWHAGAPDVTTVMRMLGALLLGSVPVLALIAASHGQLVPSTAALPVEHFVYASDLTFWALFTTWVRRASGLPTNAMGMVALFIAPQVLYVTAASAIDDVPPFLWLLPAGCAASMYGCARAVSAGAFRSTVPGHALLVRVVLFGVAMNAAQAIRTFWPEVEALREIVPATMTVGVLAIAAVIMRGWFVGPQAPSPPLAAAPRYAKSALDGEAARKLLQDLDAAMNAQKWYCDPALTLGSLAARLHVGPHLISQALNQTRGCSLTEYLAAKRVAEAARLLADHSTEHFTIDAIARDAGFRSRSAFYKTFKAATGVTPTSYRATRRRNNR